jgi:hypothetical protein
MKTYYGNIENFETLDFRQIEKIEQRCRQQRSEYIFNLAMLVFGLPVYVVQRITAIR